ncbi:hypothetical protein JW926_14095, partial [Candidatus Sumerlaeota bacterium]|nr:hypothetical protein [Candidatus Sumerlaeota bacterium]
MGEEDKSTDNPSFPEPEQAKEGNDDSRGNHSDKSEIEFQVASNDAPPHNEEDKSPLASKWLGTAEYGDMKEKMAALVSPAPQKEILALVLSVVLCDILIYHGGGFLGYAIMLPLIALILRFFSRKRKTGFIVYFLMILILLVGLRLFYLGSSLCVFFGIFLLFSLAMSLSGYLPFLPDAFLQSLSIFFRAPLNFEDYSRGISSTLGKKRFRLKIILAPMGAVFIFGFIFIMANPVLKDFFGEWLENFFENIKTL